MLLRCLLQMRPLFLIAVVLSWRSAGIFIHARPGDRIPLAASLLLSVAVFALAFVSIRARRAAWAQAVVLRPDAMSSEVNPSLFFIGFCSFLLSVWIAASAWST
jgi:hypothetical protein